MAERVVMCKLQMEYKLVECPNVSALCDMADIKTSFLPIPNAAHQALLHWPPRSPELTPCNFFMWGHIKDCVFLLLLPQDLLAPISEIDHDVLKQVWAEVNYRLDICHITKSRNRALMTYAIKTWRVSFSI